MPESLTFADFKQLFMEKSSHYMVSEGVDQLCRNINELNCFRWMGLFETQDFRGRLHLIVYLKPKDPTSKEFEKAQIELREPYVFLLTGLSQSIRKTGFGLWYDWQTDPEENPESMINYYKDQIRLLYEQTNQNPDPQPGLEVKYFGGFSFI